MKQTIINYSKKPLIQGTFWVTAGGLLGSFGNYVFNLIMGRLLTTADFGIFTSLMSLTFIISIPSSILITIVTKFTADFVAQKKYTHINILARKLTAYTAMGSALVLLGFGLFRYIISSYLHIDDTLAIAVTVGMIGFGFIASINQGMLRGLLRFNLVTYLNTAGILIKVLLGWYLVSRSFAVVGALVGNFASLIVPWVLSYIPLRRYFVRTTHVSVGLKKKLVTYSLPTFAVTAAITLFLSVDILLVKHYFSDFDAGLYSAVTLMGKAIYYALSPIAVVLFPIVAQKYARKENFLKELFFSLALTLVPGLCAVVVYFIYPTFIVNLFFPAEGFADTTRYIGIYGVYMLVFTITSLLIHFFLALEKIKLSLLALLAVCMQIGGIMIFHKDLYEVIVVSLCATGGLFIVLLYETIKLQRTLRK